MTARDFATASPSAFKDLINAWPTFKAQEIQVAEVAPDWTSATVTLALTPANGNYFGTAFGGSLFSMIDPFLVILLARQLGPEYAVWDKRVEIDFKRPGRSTVTAHVQMPAAAAAELREATAGGDAALRWFEVPLVDEDGVVVAIQRREIYVRRLPEAAGSPG